MYESVAKLPCGKVTVAKLPCGEVTGNQSNDLTNGIQSFPALRLTLSVEDTVWRTSKQVQYTCCAVGKRLRGVPPF